LAAAELNINYDFTKGGPTVYEVENNTLVNISFKYLNDEACFTYLKSKTVTDVEPFVNEGFENISNWSYGNSNGGFSFNVKCEWFFRNEYDLKDKEFIKLINSTQNQDIETYNFQFEINNVTSENVFPLLIFSMGDKHLLLQQTYYETVTFQLKQSRDINVNFDDVSALEKDTGIKEIEVVKDDVIEVRIEKIAYRNLDPMRLNWNFPNTNYFWYLENVNEIYSSNAVEPLNLLENGKSSDSVSSLINVSYLREEGSRYDVFKFKIIGEEPSQNTLSFVLLDHVDHEPAAKAEVILLMNGYEKKTVLKELEYTVTKNERNQVLEVENNSVVTIHVKNASDRCKSQNNSECEWYFVKGDLDSHGYIDYLGSIYTQEKDTYDFKFKFENLTLADVLPNLEFSYGPVNPSRSEVTPVDTLDAVVVHLANVGQVDLTFNYNIYDFMQDTIRTELYVKRNSIVQIQLSKTCFSANGVDYHWYLENFYEDNNLGALNTKGTIKENQFPLPPGSCKDEVFKFRVKGRATEPLPALKFVHHDENKSPNFQYVYVQLKMAPEEGQNPLKEVDVHYDGEKTVYDIPEGSYLLNVHIKNLSKDECSALPNGENDSINSIQCQWRFNDASYYYDVKSRYSFLDYRGRTYEQETDSFVFKFQIHNIESYNFFPYLFFYYGPAYRSFKDKNPENYFKPLRLQMAIPGAVELRLNDLPTKSKETIKKEIPVQKNEILHAIFNKTSESQWILTDYTNLDSSSDINVYDGGAVNIQPFWVKEHSEVYVYDLWIKDTATAETLPVIAFTYLRYDSSYRSDVPGLELTFILKEEKLEGKVEEKKEEKVKDEEEIKNDEKEKEGEKEEKEEEDQCMKDVGYPCCQNTQTIVTVDRDGSWGIEDSHWCLFHSESTGTGTCQSVDGFPPCTSTKTVVYVSRSNGLSWGIENNDWCLICE